MTKIEDKKNPFLERREVKMVVEAEKNPSMLQAAELISKQFKAEEDKIAIKGIKGKFGRNTFLITANIYDSKEIKEATEPKQKSKKKPATEQKATKTPEKTEEPEETEEIEKEAEEKKEETKEEAKE